MPSAAAVRRATAAAAAPLLLLFLLTSAQPPPPSAPLSSHSDLAGLYSLRGSLGLRARDWPLRADPCTAWAGVSCSSGRVVGLDLVGLRRTRLGKLSPEFNVTGLRSLTDIAVFNASGFGLPGPIPAWLNTTSLVSVDLSRCAVTGELPVSFPKLRVLSVSRNALSGGLPEGLVNASVIEELRLDGNNFSGEITASFWSLPQVRVVNLSANALTGVLPSGFTPAIASSGVSGSNRSVLDLSANSLYGAIPPGFASAFQRFHAVDLSDNYFDGEPPAAKNVLIGSNCFVGVAGQRAANVCQLFYAQRGLPYNGPVPPPPPPPPPVANTNGKSKTWIYILVGVLGGALLLVMLVGAAVAFCLCCNKGQSGGSGRRHERRERDVAAAAAGAAVSTPSFRGAPARVGSVNLAAVGDSFPYDKLVQATNGFNDENLIKHGHSGDLYRGVLEDGTTVVVVKRIGDDVAKKDGYLVELDLFSKARHDRLVPFLGHCLDNEDEKLLVYRFVRNGDLSSALHWKPPPGPEEDGMHPLDWIKRLKIATGVAEALCYLHHESSPPMVHRDIQSSSILLDDKFEVRLCSLSDACTQEADGHQNVITKLLRLSQPSEPSSSGSSATWAYDVYCFGKVLLELVTGKHSISASNDAGTKEWLDQTLPYINIYEKELVNKIIDPSLIVDEDHLEEVWAMAIVAKSCLNPKPSKRPLMKYILKALENPLKVVREDNGSGSGRLKATASSRGSWSAAIFGSWRRNSSDIGLPREDPVLTAHSQGSNGDNSFSHRRHSREICPEPSGVRDTDD